MTPNYPGSLDDDLTLPNPGDDSYTNNPDHAGLHTIENEAIIAIQTKLGILASVAATGQVLIGVGAGESEWGLVALASMVSGTLPVANGGTGVTSSTGTGNNVLSSSPTIASPTITGSPTLPSGSINFANLLSTIFGGQVTSYTNGGTGGGTFYYINLKGIKILWGVTGSVATTTTSNSNASITLPTSFFLYNSICICYCRKYGYCSTTGSSGRYV